MYKRISFFLIAVMALLMASAAVNLTHAQTKSDSVLLLEKHPLVDRIWDTRNAKWITPAQLENAIKNTTYILIS